MSNDISAQAFPAVMDNELEWILGQPCFTLRGIARLVRPDCPHKAETEQATAIHWMLLRYMKHGKDAWRAAAQAELQSLTAPSAAGSTEAK